MTSQPNQKNKEPIVENYAYNGYEYIFIKEELVISDVSDEDFTDYDRNLLKNSNKGVSLDNAWTPLGSIKEEPVSTKKRNKTEESTTRKSSTSQQIKIEVKKVVRKHARTYCPKCDKKRAVIFRQAKCRTCKSPLKYHCEKCKTCYKTYTDLTYHIKSKDIGIRVDIPINQIMTNKRHKCSKCDRDFKLLKQKNFHEKACGVEPRFCCVLCPYKFRHKSSLGFHMRYKHMERVDLKCPKCDKSYKNERSFQRHLSIYCEKKKSLECDHCMHVVYRKDQMVHHLKMKHAYLFPKHQFSCKKCNKNLKTYDRLIYHVRNCTN